MAYLLLRPVIGIDKASKTCKSGFNFHFEVGHAVDAELNFSCSLKLEALDDLRTLERLSVNIDSPNPTGVESNHPDSDSGNSEARLADFWPHIKGFSSG